MLIKAAQAELGLRHAMLGGVEIPDGCFFRIRRYAMPAFEHHAEAELRLRIAVLGQGLPNFTRTLVIAIEKGAQAAIEIGRQRCA